ncbi:hypothetical protein L226DRAFT_528312 [Lentinus tigrinus ALCF2SS1-7]|uniref:uncharacterized protein n=1 Tax=Lentinus tigrinus ALCF2SS1-7 TaxID=1328758 RepID=UPI001165CF7B|nr:hypothetical protein L226DRAFT_528312 [Lentinus tigrinus ALCF2SS1-7]
MPPASGLCVVFASCATCYPPPSAWIASNKGLPRLGAGEVQLSHAGTPLVRHGNLWLLQDASEYRSSFGSSSRSH